MDPPLLVGIFLFNEVEVLDFAGPFEVFSVTENEQTGDKLFKVITISQDGQSIKGRNGLTVVPDYSFTSMPSVDILIIPGGYGAEEIEINNQVTLDWIRTWKPKVRTLASVCTGAFLLAEAGIITNHQVTTHWMDIPRLRKRYPLLDVKENIKFIDLGDTLTSGGISAGIELSFYIISCYFDRQTAQNTAKRMEYDCDFSSFPTEEE
ncbi:DJ-1/PfpI family protein [Spirochaeta cellobiosiphila]|uniref:DJ-1/PfpI family protein n=1 Tax=Spirochaeta cellobiosiphila TaxID=504483 RepID=UPI000402C9FC|nr:DJ-1/PfpI family protein [Spirochaeta cellobiosiphila]